jgi:hypothetical protein
MQAVPYGLAKKQALILDSPSPRFVTIPSYPKGSSTVRSERAIQFTNGADLVMSETLTLSGYHASAMRATLQPLQPDIRRAVIQNELGSPATEITDATFENLADPRAPLVLHLSYLAKRQFQESEARLVGTIPGLWERYFLKMDPVPKRQTPFEISVPIELQSTIHISAPPQYEIDRGVRLDQEQSHIFLTYKTATEGDSRSVAINLRLQQSDGRYPAERYAEYRDVLSKALEVFDKRLVLAKVAR